MRDKNVSLRLQSSLLNEARKLAEDEGVGLNELINVAVAEKLSAIRTAAFFEERSSRADITRALEVLDRAGAGKPPRADDACCK